MDDDGTSNLDVTPLSGGAAKNTLSPDTMGQIKKLHQAIQQAHFEAGRIDFEMEKLQSLKTQLHQKTLEDMKEIDRIGQESAKSAGLDPARCMLNMETGELVPRT